MTHRFMFPYVDWAPTFSQKCHVLFCITLTILLQFLRPPFAIILWDSAMIGATVPETAVHEDGHLDSAQHNVGRAWQIPSVQSEADATTMELPPECDLWTC
jgi:hypothetical protein